MKIQVSTGYALRILQYFYKAKEDVITAKEMSEQINVSYLYITKLLAKLRNGGLVESKQGCYGGYQLAKKPCEISVFDVYFVMEENRPFYEAQTDMDDQYGDRYIKKYFDQIESMIIYSMRSTTLVDLFEPEKEFVKKFESQNPGQFEFKIN